jgi:hypothetical protein
MTKNQKRGLIVLDIVAIVYILINLLILLDEPGNQQ